MWEINNWEPEFVETTDDALSLCRRFRAAIIGNTIECSWIAWHAVYNEWWNGVPVILRIGGVNYEFCWTKESELALTRDSIDINRPIFYSDTNEVAYSWKRDVLPVLQKSVGQRILALQLGASGASPQSIDFIFEGAALSIYNAGDENGINDIVSESLERIDV